MTLLIVVTGAPAARLAQIFCEAPDEVVLERYAARGRRPGHLDGEILVELRERLAAGEWSPLDLDGALIELDTTRSVDMKSLTAILPR